MNKKLWTFNKKGTVTNESDANDYYYSWISLDCGGKNMEDIFKKFLGVGNSSDGVKVRVKARKGAIFIVKEGDKDDTENPSK